MKSQILSIGMVLGLAGCQGETGSSKIMFTSPVSDSPNIGNPVVVPTPDPSPSVSPSPSPSPSPTSSPTGGPVTELSHLECHYHHLQQGMYYDYTVYNYSDNTKRVGCRATNNPAVNPMYRIYAIGDTGYTDLECDYSAWFFSADGIHTDGEGMKADHYNMGTIDKTFLFAPVHCTNQ